MDFIPVKSIVSNYEEANKNWFGYNYKMNIYRGCCHGCIYCDSRSSCYQIIDFDTVKAKNNSTEIIKRDLKSKRKKGVIDTGAMSDPYNPYEKKYLLTRNALKEIDKNRFGVAISTKSPLVTRDIDILKNIKEHSPVMVRITITTYDDELCKKIEPHVSPTSQRFEALRELAGNNIYSGILLMPILPLINDNEENIRNIVKKAKEVGAKFIYMGMPGVTLRANQREYYYENIRKIFPGEKYDEKYKNVYGEEYMCTSPNSKKLYQILAEECEKCGIAYKMEDIIKAYKDPYQENQLSWF